MKTQLKIAVILIVSNLLILTLFGISIYYFSSNYSYTDFYKRLETRSKIAASYYFERNEIDYESLRKIKEQHLEKLTNEKEYIFEVKDIPDFKLLSERFVLPINLLKQINETGRSNIQIKNKFYSGLKYNKSGKTYFVIVSADNYYENHHLSLLRQHLVISFGFVLVLTISFSFYLSKRFFDPIRKITESVNKISTSNIHLRIEEKKTDHEINSLITTFNNLLNRIETAFEIQKNFISNASHEFGTPLTVLMGEADVALSKDRTVEEYKEVLAKIISQAEKLNDVSQSLLFLAQTGYKDNAQMFDIVRIDEVIICAQETMNKIAPKNQIHINFDLLPENHLKLKLKGNKHLLTLALVNILTNACKYSDNKPVYITLATSDTNLLLSIKDEGIGIPPEDMPFIFDPFYRASNTNNYDGYGIGLPLTRNIINLHNGYLSVASNLNEGTTVLIRIPQAYF